MTDLLRVLPHFPVGQFARLIPALEKHAISTSDLLTLEAADIGKRTHLPLLDVKRLCDAQHPPTSELRKTVASLSAQWQTISTLDPDLDRALGGGIPAGYVTEVTGESGAGKTQFLLSLLLSVQLPPPHGLGRPALYISTEAPLSTRRLAQMLSANPLFQRLPPSQRPSLDNIISTVTPDLESQDHILTFQVPVEVERRGIGLVVLDSVAANYRAEFERSASSSGGKHGSNMGARSTELVKLGMHLRDLAQRHNLAVVVSNQVADRFGGDEPPTHPALLLDHQQRWFTGWGDDPRAQHALKTPALGLVWTTQVAARIALSRRPAAYRARSSSLRAAGGGSGWERWMKVVFAAHAKESGVGTRGGAVGFEVWMGGLRAVGEGREEREDEGGTGDGEGEAEGE
ncbi:P-loop containing nucleoside triphosphate hydrolase protein [Chaetomium fimeti]|uniref:P-loop containing nucleoside triphosphate hydrolase protein n=1 Tax=Chaetomium fimeti TaxID=1854472 RepID=A0AAE0HL21_9PEZI|nr:P-loop containing nucleoside triphosphate hydrolase protein [Chaetomium fimeti]